MCQCHYLPPCLSVCLPAAVCLCCFRRQLLLELKVQSSHVHTFIHTHVLIYFMKAPPPQHSAACFTLLSGTCKEQCQQIECVLCVQSLFIGVNKLRSNWNVASVDERVSFFEYGRSVGRPAKIFELFRPSSAGRAWCVLPASRHLFAHSVPLDFGFCSVLPLSLHFNAVNPLCFGLLCDSYECVIMHKGSIRSPLLGCHVRCFCCCSELPLPLLLLFLSLLLVKVHWADTKLYQVDKKIKFLIGLSWQI